ncbi:cytochrome-c peroxidase [Sulfurimonas autotrophica]|uniref:Cytochrome-c peroxidase n=1 Tax=Sulfurimonas autotrophica (strain ATCC BAA-671 / DSM 16294 / JCM 11897 / OK10) TaxID=563040 RepID=E0URZ2_SULAO|nr:cytochrome-c peroxidase [Sulfurimonas autotrophica]ADN09015.1 Cytochrome-c peroxidase [Sulfurimonas autotrophica DSM 16294]
MKKIVALTLTAASLMASSLVQDAKNAGLAPIPTEASKLLKLIDNPKNPITKAKVELGKKLYFDPRLSKSGLISCNTCHNLSKGGDDGMQAAVGHKWTANPHHLSSPTVYNAVFNDKQFWDGRSPDVEDQAQGPIQAAPEMAATQEHVVAVVTSMPAYVKEFQKAYGKNVKITFKKVADTIGLFERTLVTPAPFDAFMNGDENAMTKKQKEGLKTFIQVGCASCHNGVGIGGGMNAFNVVAKYKYMNVGDFKGDANGMVKVPTLRNVTQTAPYFHNGMIPTLKDAIKEMGRIQLGANISDKQAKSIEAFLGALDGKKPYVKLPMLPATNDNTPKPELN